MNRKDFGAAAMELERAHALRPDDTVAEYSLGMALLANGRGQEGVAHLRHAVESGVTVDGARYALANAMLATGDSEGAVGLLATYAPAEGDSADSCYQVALLAMDAGAPDVAAPLSAARAATAPRAGPRRSAHWSRSLAQITL